MEKIILSWTRYIELLENLTQRLLEVQVTEKFDFILGIGRGGLIPATYLSHMLGLPLVTVMAQAYRDTTQAGFKIGHISTLLEGEFKDKHVLIIDDLVDSAVTLRETIKYVTQTIIEPYRITKYKVAVVIKKTPSTYSPDYFAVEMSSDKWLVHPYEKFNDKEEGGGH